MGVKGITVTSMVLSKQKLYKNSSFEYLFPFNEGLSLNEKTFLVCSKYLFDSLPMIEQSSQAATFLQFNMWSMTDLSSVSLTCLTVPRDTR